MSVVHSSITIDAPVETVWQYLADPDLLAGWLMRNNFAPRVGRHFEFRAKPGRGWDGAIKCKLIDFEPPNRISFTWDANDIEAETLVTISLTAEDEKTRLDLLHSNFEAAPGDVARIVKRHDEGWRDHLSLLRQQVLRESGDAEDSETDVDWRQFELHFFINAEPTAVLDYWRTTAGMEAFFVQMMRITDPAGEQRADGEPARPGDRYCWRWHNGNTLAGQLLETDTEATVRFSFGESEVSVGVRPYVDGTLLRLAQFMTDDDERTRYHLHANCRAAWVYFLANLRSVVEHAQDLRDKNRATAGSVSTRYKPPVDFG